MADGIEIKAPHGWRVDDGAARMSVEVRTKDFVEAVEAIREIADIAEELEHHPDIHLEEWNRLRIVTWSHDTGGLTHRDERLARRVGEALRRRGLLS